MGYLKCDDCAGYYELQEGEYPEDFDSCHCGGHLEYTDELADLKFKDKLISYINIKRIVAVLVGGMIMLLSFYLFSPDPYSANFAYNDNASFYIWFAGGLVAALLAGGNIRSGASNGFYSAILSGLLVIIYFYLITNNYFNNPVLADNLALFAALCAVYLFIPAIFSVSGGLIAIIARKTFKKLA